MVGATTMIATAAVAGQRVYVHVPTVTAATMNVDRDACVKETLVFINGPRSPAPPIRNPTTGPAIAHALDMHGPKLAAAHEAQCMADRGYSALELTDAERRVLGKMHNAAGRDRWYDAFAAGDLTGRIAAGRAGGIH